MVPHLPKAASPEESTSYSCWRVGSLETLDSLFNGTATATAHSVLFRLPVATVVPGFYPSRPRTRFSTSGVSSVVVEDRWQQMFHGLDGFGRGTVPVIGTELSDLCHSHGHG
jgi:hypothetical protein